MTLPVPSRSLSALVALSACLLAACGDKADNAAPATPDAGVPSAAMVIRLGHVAPLTGPQAHLGKDNENGARLAVDDGWDIAEEDRLVKTEVRLERPRSSRQLLPRPPARGGGAGSGATGAPGAPAVRGLARRADDRLAAARHRHVWW